MEVDPEESVDEMYRLVTSVVIPRPIAWVSTVGADGVDNLAPYSFHNGVVEDDPPVVMFSAEDGDDGDPKDTARNVLDTGEFVLNLVTEDLVERMDRTADGVAPGESEFDHAGLDRAAASVVSAPMVAAAKVNMECTLYDTLRIGDHTVVLGEIRLIHVDDDLLADGNIDVRKVDAVGRLTGSYYARLDRFTVE